MRILATVPLFLALSSLGAQAPDGPLAGSWGAEASAFSSASLLRFRSATSAWITGVSLAFFREDVEPEPTPPALSGDRTVVFFDYRVGIRRYSAKDGSRVRRFSTVSALISFDDVEFQTGWNYGLAGDVGAAYFFTPNVSLGVSAELTARYGQARRDFVGVNEDVTTYSVSFTGFRLLGAVYF